MAPAIDDDEALRSAELDLSDGAETRVGLLVADTYRIIRHIGSGGSSHVFEATHQRLGKAFALKLLRPEIGHGRRVAQRFRREAKAIAGLQSEHVISVVDCGELPDQTPYLVMELLDGEDLRSLLSREGQLPARRTVHLVVEACRGLTTVHAAGLVHRDLKPENLFIARRSTGEDWCKVLDFGVAKMDASLSTAQGAIVGTVRYMAPEQLADSATVDARTDVYALGAILYECLSGRSLHEGDTVQKVMYSVVHKEPPPLSELRPDLPRALTAVVARASSKAMDARPASTAELAQLLLVAVGSDLPLGAAHTLAEDDHVAVPLPMTEGKAASRRWVGVAALTGVAGLVAGSFMAPQATPQANASAASMAPASLGAEVGREAALVPSPLPSAPSGVSATTSALPAAVTAAAASVPSLPVKLEAPRRSKDAKGAPAARVAAPSASGTRGVAVGRFDAANPYGE